MYGDLSRSSTTAGETEPAPEYLRESLCFNACRYLVDYLADEISVTGQFQTTCQVLDVGVALTSRIACHSESFSGFNIEIQVVLWKSAAPEGESVNAREISQ